MRSKKVKVWQNFPATVCAEYRIDVLSLEEIAILTVAMIFRSLDQFARGI
jgi:hypothetical protein